MIKRTLYFGNPAYLSRRDEQLVVRLPAVENNSTLPDSFKKEAQATIPIEDIGVVILDDQQVIITQALMASLLENNVALITCDRTHHPTGLMLNLAGNTLQSAKFKAQLDAGQPLVKQLWQQTIRAKITNQASMLKKLGKEATNMTKWAADVKSGDPDNLEARAAAYYWKTIFPEINGFTRNREGMPPNNLLNYGYAILRAITARAIVSSGMLPTLGIFHRNKYNAYCLADDIMEPYRPYVDLIVCHIMETEDSYEELTTDFKKQLLSIASIDVFIDGKNSPLMVAMSRTTHSLHECFEGTARKILYPVYV